MVLLGWVWSSPPGSDTRDLDFNYEDRGGGGGDGGSPPDLDLTEQRRESIKRQGFAINHSRVKIGHGRGQDDFLRAKKLLQDWRHFQLGWAFVPRETPIEPGRGFNVCCKEALAWIVNPLRIRYVRDDADPHDAAAKNRIVYAFGSGTLQGHLLAGEERFSVEWNKEDGSIWYEIFSFSKPAHFLSLAAYPYVRFKQRVFAKHSSEKMVQEMRPRDPCM